MSWLGPDFRPGGFVFGAIADSLGSSASLIIGCGFVILVTISIGILNPNLRRLRIRV